MSIRTPDFAGSWYPATKEEVNRSLEEMARDRPLPEELPDGPLGGGVLPHAGWAFSGSIAYLVVRALASRGPAPERLCVFGNHLGPGDPPTILVEGAWRTPHGDLPVAPEAEELARDLDLERERPERYRRDNGIELLLPFLSATWGEIPLIAVGVPPIAETAARIGRRTTETLAGRTALFFGSTDLTHYGPRYGFSPEGVGREALEWVRESNDAGFVKLCLEGRGGEAIRHAKENRSACCPGAAAAALAATEADAGKRPRGHLLAYDTSEDIQPSGRPTNFVGYAGIVF